MFTRKGFLTGGFAVATASGVRGALGTTCLAAAKSALATPDVKFKDLQTVSVFSDSLAVKRVNPDKYYLIDSGLIRAMCVKNDAERGWMLENIVYMALRRNGGRVSYIVNRDGTEVDFHVHDAVSHEERLVQVSYAMSDEKTFLREMNALKLARESTGIRDCTIVTWDDEDESDGVRIVPVWKWLLMV